MKQSKEVPLTIVTVQLESKNKKTYLNSNTYHHESILFIASKVNIYTDKQTQRHMTRCTTTTTSLLIQTYSATRFLCYKKNFIRTTSLRFPLN